MPVGCAVGRPRTERFCAEFPAQFESVQLETSDITLYETFFETVLQADRV